jgi:hypothetical protein
MRRMSTYSLEEVTALRVRLDRELHCETVAESAQTFTDILFKELAQSAVLFRLFVTVPFAVLGERERSFASALALGRGCAHELNDATSVICLLGSSGIRASWNDRHQSRRHLAIPVVTASFIQTVPMVSRLMSDMGTGLEWVEKQESRIVVKSFGRMARVLYVEDAATTRTSDGFNVVPEREFVSENGVKTVVGLGGAYLSGSIVTAIFFTNELVPKRTVERFMPVINTFKVATMKLVAERRFFE